MWTGTRLLRGSVSALAMMTVAGLAHAQDVTQTAQAAPTAGTAGAPVEQIEVTGIRLSLQKSMDVKRNADGVVDAVSATDIGKLPDKNIADALQRLPGVNTIQSASAGSGGFGENDRVQIRGTAPALTQTLVDGHSISSGDWFILDSLSAASRSVSYDLLPVDIVDHSGRLQELPGGSAGRRHCRLDQHRHQEPRSTSRIRSPLRSSSAAPTTISPVVQARSSMAWWPGRTTPAPSACPSSASATIATSVATARSSWVTAPSRPVPRSRTAIPNPFPAAIRGAAFPQIINNALFEQEQLRQGGDVAVEFKPNNQWDFKLDGFYSYLNASNYNQGDLVDLNDFVNNGVAPTSYTVKNGILTSATFPGSTARGNPGINDIYRPGAGSSTYYIDGNTTYKPTL